MARSKKQDTAKKPDSDSGRERTCPICQRYVLTNTAQVKVDGECFHYEPCLFTYLKQHYGLPVYQIEFETEPDGAPLHLLSQSQVESIVESEFGDAARQALIDLRQHTVLTVTGGILSMFAEADRWSRTQQPKHKNGKKKK